MLLTDWCWQVSRCGWHQVSLRSTRARRWSAAQWCEQRALFCRQSPDCSSSPTWLTYTSCSSLSTLYVVYFVHRFILAWEIAATLYAVGVLIEIYVYRVVYRVRQNKMSQHENRYMSEMREYFCTKCLLICLAHNFAQTCCFMLYLLDVYEID